MSPIANMLVQIKNAQARSIEEIILPFSKMKFDIAMILKEKGFIGEVEKRKKKMKKAELNFIAIQLKYVDGVGAISEIKLVSKPSRRMYAAKNDLKPIMNGYGISVVSTSKGLMTGSDARKAGIGGEVIFEVW
jgi:small subunit ribosomal protein S8